jgi:ferredoxin
MMENIYHRLSEAYKFAESRYLSKILERCLTEQEALILLALPGTAEDVAGKLRVDVSSVQSTLVELFNKGFAFCDPVEGKRRYRLMGSWAELRDALVTGKHVDQFGNETLDLLAAMYDEEVSPAFDVEGSEFRVIPVHETIEPGTEILSYEKISGILEKAETIAVMNCPCRTVSRRCNNPRETCITLNRAAKYMLERGAAREITRDEALSILNMCEESGLVHMTGNASHGVPAICNCCTCCCDYLRAQIVLGKKYASVKSRYRAVVDPMLCNECGLCIDRCNFGAMKMVNSKLGVEEEKCFWCGLCAYQCPVNAINLIQVRGPEHIPTREAEPWFSSN